MKNRSDCVQGRARRTGFTLIELLTVIAIIAILASISFVGVSRYLEKAKESQTIANMDSITLSLSEYAARTDNTTGFPPGYGFVKIESREIPVGSLSNAGDNDNDFVTTPYTSFLGLHGDESTRQLPRYGSSYDLNRDGSIGLMEYLPVGEKDAGGTNYYFTYELYVLFAANPTSGGVNELQAQSDPGVQRPFVYVPFNSRQLQNVRRYWRSTGDEFGTTYDQDAAELTGRMFFPPSNYDGFVLIGNGPGGDNGGVVAEPSAKSGGGYADNHAYHIASLRTAFLATRDWDNDGLLDFEYRARQQATTPAVTPNGERGFGAFIKVVQ